MSTPDQARREIPVFDAVLMRPRVVVVAVAETRVVVLPPPGEGFVAPPTSVPLLVEALLDANQLAADRRRRGHPGAGQ